MKAARFGRKNASRQQKVLWNWGFTEVQSVHIQALDPPDGILPGSGSYHQLFKFSFGR